MKLLLTISLGLLALSLPAICWPQTDDNLPPESEMQQDNDYGYLQQDDNDQGMAEREGEMQQNDDDGYLQQDDNDQGMAEREGEMQQDDYGYLQQDDTEMPDEDSAKQLMTQLAEANQDDEEAMEQVKVLMSGSTVGLRLSGCGRWLTCRTTFCSSTHRACAAARFKMFKSRPGPILTGDFIGLHYSYGRPSWFSLKNCVGQKSVCPGTPSVFGFKTCPLWHTCQTEVFQIYAKGKGLGARITNKDIVALYHPGVTASGFVQFLSSKVRLSQCLLQKSGNCRPPSVSAFHRCKADTVQINIFR
jgi:hypothetical protein